MAVTNVLRGLLRMQGNKDLPSLAFEDGGDLPLVSDSTLLTLAQSSQAYYHYLFKSGHQEPLTVPQKLVLTSVRDTLQNREERLNAIPRLPSVIPRLLQSLRDPDSSVKDYVAIVNKDPVMSSAVLKLANSVYFNSTGSYVGDIERAIVKLGISGLRSVLSAAVMQPIIQRDSAYFPQTGHRLWLHSIHCAVACELIGQKRDLERFKVYLMGLVHDLGKITLFCELCKQHKLNGDRDPGRNAFVPLLKALSAPLGYLIARDWQLPDSICTALKEQIDLTPGKPISPYGQLLYQANMACETYAFMPPEKRGELTTLQSEFDLPADLFMKLDQVGMQL